MRVRSFSIHKRRWCRGPIFSRYVPSRLGSYTGTLKTAVWICLNLFTIFLLALKAQICHDLTDRYAGFLHTAILIAHVAVLGADIVQHQAYDSAHGCHQLRVVGHPAWIFLLSYAAHPLSLLQLIDINMLAGAKDSQPVAGSKSKSSSARRVIPDLMCPDRQLLRSCWTSSKPFN